MILRTIDVDDGSVIFDLPLNQTTDVVLTEDVPLFANATFTLPGGGGRINGRVDIVLPRDLVLPVRLDMTVPVNDHPGPPAGGRRNPAQRDPTSRSIRQSA